MLVYINIAWDFRDIFSEELGYGQDFKELYLDKFFILRFMCPIFYCMRGECRAAGRAGAEGCFSACAGLE